MNDRQEILIFLLAEQALGRLGPERIEVLGALEINADDEVLLGQGVTMGATEFSEKFPDMARAKGAREAYAYRSPAKRSVMFVGLTRHPDLVIREVNGRFQFEMRRD